MTSKQRVLLIEDDEEQREILSIVLKKNSYNVIEVEHAEAAQEYLNDSTVDLIVLDIALTFMNGFEFLEINNALINKKEIKVVVVTGQTSTAIDSLVEEYSCCKYLFKKPLDLKFFIKTIQEII